MIPGGSPRLTARPKPPPTADKDVAAVVAGEARGEVRR